MAKLLLKVKTKNGQHVLSDLNANHTLSDLKKELSSLSGIQESILNVLSGFPPKIIDLADDNKTLSVAGISSGDTLIVEEKTGQNMEPPKPQPDPTTEEYAHQMSARGVLLRKTVPSDNSCLFTSVGYVLSSKISLDCGDYMRQLIVQHVKDDPSTYCEAVLGKSPDEYCKWILNPNSWGGAIELSILSKYYGIEIAVVDTVNGIINRFGEDRNYGSRVLLIFDGIHYDPLYMESPQTADIQTIFPADDAAVLVDAQTLAEESKSSRQFTDVDKFHLKCLDCQTILKGQVEAQAHAKATSHINFGEV